MPERPLKNSPLAVRLCLLAAALCTARSAGADAGPPFLTNDPGTPGNGDWEINIAAMQTTLPGLSSWQLPQLDVNYGLGDRIQLTVEIPYLVGSSSGERQVSGWGNAYPGVKWRFFDRGEGGWQIATFPQVQTAGSAATRRAGLSVDGPRLLLPLEVARTVDAYRFDLEAGYYFPGHGPEERILGFVVGRQVTSRLELDVELYNDHVTDDSPQVTTLDLGGRYKLARGFNLLFMAGRSLSGNSPGQVEFMGYLGIQILLSDYGRSLGAER
jgi:hypothetical protein